MEEEAPISTQTTNEDAGVSCARCQRMLRGLPGGARFCPKCGGDLPLAVLPIESTPTIRQRIEQLQFILREHLGADSPAPSLDKVHSLMLLGYANAMLQLGARYERGLGVARNNDEAERCYTKSAKLGNVYARARLGDNPGNVRIVADLAAEDAVPVQTIEPTVEENISAPLSTQAAG